MDINKKKFIVDFLIFLDFLVVAISGFILWLVLPRGSGKTGSSFLFLREDWVFIHNWGSVVLIILILFHLIFNITWIKAMFRNLFRGK